MKIQWHISSKKNNNNKDPTTKLANINLKIEKKNPMKIGKNSDS